MRLSFKIAIYMVGVIAFALILLTYLTNAKFRSLQEEVERSRFLVLALDIKATAERGLALGLGLEQMNNLAGILNRLRSEHPEILSLQIVNDRGDSLHGSEATLERPQLAQALQRIKVQSGSESSCAVELSSEAAFGLALPLVNSFGQVVGAVVLQYDRATSDMAARAVTFEQVRIGGLTLLLAGLIAMTFTAAYMRRLTRSFVEMTRLIEVPPGASTRPAAHTLDRRFHQMRAQAEELEGKVAEVEKALAGFAPERLREARRSGA